MRLLRYLDDYQAYDCGSLVILVYWLFCLTNLAHSIFQFLNKGFMTECSVSYWCKCRKMVLVLAWLHWGKYLDRAKHHKKLNKWNLYMKVSRWNKITKFVLYSVVYYILKNWKSHLWMPFWGSGGKLWNIGVCSIDIHSLCKFMTFANFYV